MNSEIAQSLPNSVTNQALTPHCYALVPAAGSGSRMGQSGPPKQYLPLLGKPLIWYALNTLCSVKRIAQVFVVLAAGDETWSASEFSDFAEKLTVLHCGGETRSISVGNGLAAMRECLGGNSNDVDREWVLVHDAARPGVTVEQVDRLIDAVIDTENGGILAIPVADTLKRAADSELPKIATTVNRERLWQAQTPQMFRLRMLAEALEATPVVTDEAGALERLGLHPRLVTGDITNFKVTYPQDLALAELILRDRKRDST
jgi:2-C-methyl-D-erythritol 4-phosphate cytidylyltransferase